MICDIHVLFPNGIHILTVQKCFTSQSGKFPELDKFFTKTESCLHLSVAI